jgi:hypothetical protein
MNRRAFVGGLVAAAAGVVAASSAATTTPPRKYGRLTVQGHMAHKRATGEDLHVFVDGVDVTENCFEADDTDGYVKVFCRDRDHHRALDAKGARHVDARVGGACQMVVRGAVVIAPGAKLA